MFELFFTLFACLPPPHLIPKHSLGTFFLIPKLTIPPFLISPPIAVTLINPEKKLFFLKLSVFNFSNFPPSAATAPKETNYFELASAFF